MDSRLCEKLNQKFLTRKLPQRIYTHQSAKAWKFIEKSFLSLAKNSSSPKQLCVRIRFENNNSIVTLSNGSQLNADLTMQGVKDVIPRAESEGIKVEADLSKNEFSFTFTPSNY